MVQHLSFSFFSVARSSLMLSSPFASLEPPTKGHLAPTIPGFYELYFRTNKATVWPECSADLQQGRSYKAYFKKNKIYSSDKIAENVLCSYYNVGYCKYKNKCSKEHAKADCIDQKCQKKLPKNTETLVDMDQNADPKVRVHVNLSMKLNLMKKKYIVTKKMKRNL